jgi:hypothetical protein
VAQSVSGFSLCWMSRPTRRSKSLRVGCMQMACMHMYTLCWECHTLVGSRLWVQLGTWQQEDPTALCWLFVW